MVKLNCRRWLAPFAGVALGIALFGASGLSVTQAQQDDVVVGSVADDAFIHNLLEEIFAEVFGEDSDAASDVSGGGDINVGGNMGGSVTMGGGSGGGISIGGGESGS